MLVTSFKIHYPGNTTLFTPDSPRDNLLEAVCDCGIISESVAIEYLADGETEYQPVPADVREQARAYWDGILAAMDEE